MKQYTCPVCGYGELAEPPYDYTICPSCGTEFGYTDSTRTHQELRQQWIASGRHWHSRVTPRPINWDADKQLERVLNPVVTKASNTTIRLVALTPTETKSGARTTSASAIATPIPNQYPTEVPTLVFT